MSLVRPSRDEDVPAVTSIYAYYVSNTTTTLELTPPTIDEITRRRSDVLSKHLPYLVVEHENQVIGFAYCDWFKPRAAYRFSLEHHIYVHQDMRGKGFGRQLLNSLMVEAASVGARKLIAVIGDSTNVASIGLHQAAGFEQAGTLRSCGWKFKRWLDVVLMEKSLGAGHTTSPE